MGELADDTPGDPADATNLIKWYNDGADGQIDWGTKGDFEQCVAIAGQHVSNAEGFCAERHHDATGDFPGPHDSCTATESTPYAIHASSSHLGQHGGSMKPRNRDQIIADWAAVINGPGLVASGGEADEAFTNAALAASYNAVSTEFYETTGELPYWVLISQEDRDKAAATGAAMPDGSYPITTCDGENSVQTAIGAVGRGNASHNAIRKHIITRAHSLDCANLIPDNWNSDGSLKADGASAAAGEAFAPPPPPPPPPAGDAPPKPPPPPPPAADKAPPAAGDKPDGAAEADAGITEAIKALATAADNAVAAQKADPDNATDPKDAKVLAGLEQVQAILVTVQKDQDADAGETVAKPAAPPPPAPDDTHNAPGQDTGAKPLPPVTAAGPPQAPVQPPSTTPGNAGGVPGDADDSPPGPGDIEADIPCNNPDCGHLAAVHEDLQQGMNSGACTTPGCTCPGMVPDADQVTGPGDTPPPAAADDDAPQKMTMAEAIELAKRGAAAFAGPTDLAPAPDAPPADLLEAPAVSGAPAPVLPPLNAIPETVGPAFTMPVAALEGVPTGDGRIVNPDALTWRVPPLPLMGLKTSPHDPSGMSPNDPAVLIGRIESFTREGSVISGNGHLLTTPEGADFTDILSQMGRMGVSIDVGAVEVTVAADPNQPPSADVFDIPLIEALTKGEIMGATVCPFAAFAGAYIVLGDGADQPAGDLQPAPADAKMAIRYVDAEVCEACEGDTALVASGAPGTAGPVAPPLAWFQDPAFTVGDDRLRETIDARTGRPSGKFACPITVTEDGRVFGHIAQWGVCHQSPKFLNKGECVMAPRSKTNYALFHNGHVLTAEGELISCGKLTADAGHASTEGLTAAQVNAHYDNSALTAAVVRAGEDEFGIWVAGSVHPSASPEQVFTLRANPPSGDWRPFGVGNELRHVLHVNNPGFPIVQAMMRNGRIESLVAAGVPMFELPTAPAEPLSIEQRMDAFERVVAPLAKAEMVRQYAEITGT